MNIYESIVSVIHRCPFCLNKKEPVINLNERSIMANDFNDDVGKEFAFEKRKILLPYLKKKWKEEAKKIDALRMKALKESPKIHSKISYRKKELSNELKIILLKPNTVPNNYNRDMIRSRINELDKIISIIDEELK